MESLEAVLFPPFRLDPLNARLWREGDLVPLRPKLFSLLCYLVMHAGELIPKEVLQKLVWPESHVSGGLLKGSIRELRKVLGDDVEAPRFIETVHGWGYRFIAQVTHDPLSIVSEAREGLVGEQTATEDERPKTQVVGRDAELARLHTCWKKALDGQRQIVFITGEPGIGKTKLVEAFLRQIETTRHISRLQPEIYGLRSAIRKPASAVPLIALGQCIEHCSTREAYLPVLEACERLCREPGGEQAQAILRQYAPTWMLQMPTFLSATELEDVRRRSVGSAQERMLREMAQAIEMLTAVRPLILWLEDLHGSDYATLDLLSFLARRREPARLMVIGTYRPFVVRTGEHPLYPIQQELQLREQCYELAVAPLPEGAVAEYLESRIAGGAKQTLSLRHMARVVHERTEGNPLFMVNVVETALRHEDVGEGIEAIGRTVPVNLRQFIEQQIAHLRPADQRLLEAMSVAGIDCPVATIAAALGEPTAEVEERCAAFARQGHFLSGSGFREWPDETVTPCYRFIHALYQEVLYERVTEGRRVTLHKRIAERLEQAYGSRVHEVAVELTRHYEQGRGYQCAVKYLHLAGETALRLHAQKEAVAFFTKALHLLPTLPETPDRFQQEVRLQMALGLSLCMAKSYACPEVERAYTRAKELCRHLREPTQLSPVLRGLWAFSIVRAQHHAAQELGHQLFRLAQDVDDKALLLEAHLALGVSLSFLGDLPAAQEHLEQGIALYDPQHCYAFPLPYSNDPGVGCLTAAAWVLALRGNTEQALARADEALKLARKLDDPLNLAGTLLWSAIVSEFCHQQRTDARQRVEEAVTLSTEQGFPLLVAKGRILRGAMRAREGQIAAGIKQMQQGLAAYRATGAEVLHTYFLALLAEAYGAVGRTNEANRLLGEALTRMEETGERLYEAELLRLKKAFNRNRKEARTGIDRLPIKRNRRSESPHSIS